MKRIAIIEDVSLIADQLADDLTRLQYDCIGIANNLTEAQKLISQESVNLVILDIDLNGIESGLDLVPELKKRQIPFVVLTDLKNSSTERLVLEHEPDGFLTKPVTLANLKSTLALVFSKTRAVSNVKRFHFKQSNGFTKLINFEDILYVKSDRGGREVHFKSGMKAERVVDTETLTSFLEDANSEDFLQVHRSFIVNCNYVESYSYTELKLQFIDVKIPIGKTHRQEIGTLFSSQ